MTSFRELLRDVADQVEPIDDLAGKALGTHRPERRVRRMPVALLAATSVAVVLSMVVFGAGLLDGGTTKPSENPPVGPDGSTIVHFPEDAPPLPDKGVGPVLLSYLMSCNGPDGESRDCAHWRVMTTDGQHYEVDGPADPEHWGSGLFVSPDGDRIAYFREDGALVLRELATGRTTTPFEWDPSAVYGLDSTTWSADGRWLFVVPGEDAFVPAEGGGSTSHRLDEPARLVDTETGDVVELGDGSGDTYGLPDGDRPFPFDGVEATGDGLPLVDHSGEIVGEISNDLMPGQHVDGKLAHISPDGRTLSVITFPKDQASDVDGGRPLITIVDVENERILRDFRIERSWKVWDSPDFIGWVDESTALIETRYLKGEIPLGPNDSALAQVDAFDIETGKLRRVLEFPDRPNGLYIAYNQL